MTPLCLLSIFTFKKAYFSFEQPKENLTPPFDTLCPTDYCYLGEGASMPEAAALQKILGIDPGNTDLLEQALVHSSYVNENPGSAPGNNERLEFLGDAVLDCIVADKLYRDMPALSEGDMTRLRASLVQRETLAGIARRIDLGNFLRMGKGEEASGGRSKAPNLAGALEAVIAAVYLDSGMEIAAGLVLRLLGDAWEQAVREGSSTDYKSQLQEITQCRFQLTPVYRLVEETGPDHAKVFTVEVSAGGRALGKGTGKSKKLAETKAARMALERLEESFTG
jgi:ribonuclease III